VVVELLNYTSLALGTGLSIFILIGLIILKGMALYKSARLNDKVWFWIMLIISSFGIIPAIYLIIKRKEKGVKK
jgi:hypothetical protein